MGKLNIKLAGIAAAGLLVASPVWATPVNVSGSNGEDSLQTVFDNFTIGGSSSVDVQADMLGDANDSYWSITGAGGSISTMIIEIAGNAGSNAVGVYDKSNSNNKVVLFDGDDSAGTAQTRLSILLNGDVLIEGDVKGNFAANSFGFYLDGPGGTFFSDSALNLNGADQMVAYQGTYEDTIQVGDFAQGVWTDNEFVLAWEDVENSGDNDYNDFVFIVESVIPVPAPATLALLGLGLIGLGFRARRKAAAA